MSASRPRRIIDLDALPRTAWRLSGESVYVLGGRLYEWARAGCMLCIECEDDAADRQTLVALGAPGDAVCLTHGSLERLEFLITRSFTVTVGGRAISGECTRRWTFFVPVSVKGTEREDLVGKVLEEFRVLEEHEFEQDYPAASDEPTGDGTPATGETP